MKSLFRKLWWSIPGILVLIIMILYVHQLENVYRVDDIDKSSFLSFSISTENGNTEKLRAWYDEGVYYVFLPSYADLKCVTAFPDTNYDVIIDGKSLNDLTNISCFSLGVSYDMEIIGGNKLNGDYSIQFLKSDNVSALYIDTFSRNMEKIHGDKEYKEYVSVSLIDDNGECLYYSVNDKINSRGNSTWYKGKKPYLLSLSKSASLLGMPESDKWVLLAGALDITSMKTKLIFDFAKAVGFNAVPDCRYVDLYLNGNYAGLYILSEKAEAVFDRVNDSYDGSGILCALDREGEIFTLENQPIAIKSPKKNYFGKEEYVLSRVQMLEDGIKTGKDLKTIIDMESWVKRYIIEEIFENVDSVRNSSYFYFYNEDINSLFYAGPLWDVDMTWGFSPISENPKTFIANEAWRSTILYHPWYHWLYENGEFREAVVYFYLNEIKPHLEKIIDSKIDFLADQIGAAQRNNDIRWHIDQQDINELKDYLQKRIDFLDSAWRDAEDYAFIQIQYCSGSEYLNFSVKKGSLFSGLPEKYLSELDDPVWIDRDTGERFDFDTPVIKDTTLLLMNPSENDSQIEKIENDELSFLDSPISYLWQRKTMLFLLSSAVLLGTMLLCFILIDLKRIPKGNKNVRKSR